MANFTFKIEERGTVLSEQGRGWNLEVNKVSWNGNAAKWDIRAWNEDHSQCGKGITLTEEQFKALVAFGKEV